MKVQVSPKLCVIVRRKAPRLVVPLAKKASVSIVPSALYDLAMNHHTPDVHSLLVSTVSTEILSHLLKL